MSLENDNDAYSDMVETDQEAGNEENAQPVITLSFGNTGGRAWDDRELIRAYDAAMDEFHAYHPGPGSWLDKATAALKAGKPIPGTVPTSEWYTTSDVPEQSANGTTAQSSKDVEKSEPPAKKQKTARVSTTAINPYAALPASSSHQRAPSPSYAPPSPPARVEPTGYDGDDYGDGDEDDWQDGEGEYEYQGGEDAGQGEEGWYDESFALSEAQAQPAAQPHHFQPQQQLPPAPASGVQDTSTASVSDAFTFAMSAQYWAGYWMGVVQAKIQGASPTAAPPPPTIAAPSSGIATRTLNRPKERPETNSTANGTTSGTSNIRVTRKQFHRPRPLKR